MASIEEAANRIMSLASDSECTRFAKCTFKSNGSCARCLNSKTHSARRRHRRRGRRAPLADTPVRLDAGLSSLYGYVNCSRCRGITTIRVGWYAESTAATAAKPPTADENDAVDPRIFDLMKLVPTRAKFGRKQRRKADAKSEPLVATPPSVDGVEQPAGEHSAIPAVAAAAVATVAAASEPPSGAIANRRSFDEAGVSDSPDCTVATVPEAGVGRADVVMFDLAEVATSGDAVASTSGEAKSGRSDDATCSPKEEVVVVVGGEEGDDIAKPDETADDIAKPDETADSTPEAGVPGEAAIDVVAEAKEATASPKIGASGSRDVKMSSPTPREPAIPPKAHRHRVRRKRENDSAKSAPIAASKPPRAAKRAVCLNCRADRRVVTGKQTQKVPVPLPANPSKPPPPCQQQHHHVTYGYSDERVCAIVAARCRTYVADPDLYFLGEIAKLPQVLALKNSPERKTFNLINLFTYGNISNYIKHKEHYPTLSEDEITKLRKLTFLSLCSKKAVISFNIILKELFMDDVYEMEKIILESIFSKLLEGLVDQIKQEFCVINVKGRDPVDPINLLNSISHMSRGCNRLINQYKYCNSTVADAKKKMWTNCNKKVSKKNVSQKDYHPFNSNASQKLSRRNISSNKSSSKVTANKPSNKTSTSKSSNKDIQQMVIRT